LKYASRARYKGQLRSDLEKIKNYAALALEKQGSELDVNIHGTYGRPLPEDGLSADPAKKSDELKEATSDAYAKTMSVSDHNLHIDAMSEEEVPLREYRKAVAGKNGQFDPENDG